MQLYNTATRSVEEFRPADGQTVKLYTCGPTVYDYLHVGNWATNIRWDVLARVLQRDWKLEWYMNITDVGHLVSDADEGEDKLEKGARREGKTAWEVAEFYTADFLAGLILTNNSIAKDHIVKATDHIAEQIELIQRLEENGYTYQIDDGVYFDSSKFADYGKMAKLDIAGLQAGARVELGHKKHPTDFALWKFSPRGQKRDMEWTSPWGKGFPGWHIECSAMAMKYLGETLDIHGGGIDHIPVHHTNEIAQSEAATGKTFSRFWLHSNFVTMNEEKIAKSAGNGITLHEVTERGYTGSDLRLLVLQSHYRTQANFTWNLIESAKQRLKRWQAVADLRWQLLESPPEASSILESSVHEIIMALQNDLDTPQALAAIERGMSAVEPGVARTAEPALRNFLDTIEQLLGLNLTATPDITDEQKKRIADRSSAKSNNDWMTADKLRDELLTEGIILRDTDHGTFWSRG